jgi:MFS family permease
MTSTQLLGAFNDNLFKQLVMLICVDAARPDRLGRDYQPLALALFAIPFVMFSGFAGFLSDRISKRGIVVSMKIAEIAIMLAGMGAFFLGGILPDWQLPLLFVVLFLMSTQSAFFGPSKYGILPELFADRDLPQANGMIQMTTFLAIIFGFAAAGYGKEWFQDSLWMVSAMCVGIAVLGTCTSLFVRKTPVARPGLEFEWSAVGINRETRNMLKGDRLLVEVLLISSLFWFLGGVMQPTTNSFGKQQLELGDANTSLLGAFMGVGIAVGCVVAGKLSREKINFGLVRIGSWGLVGSLSWLCLLGVAHSAENPGAWGNLFPNSLTETYSRLGMLGVGFFGGLFIVPLQVFLQARPPEDQKGRMIGTMNLINWIAICLAAAFVAISTLVLKAIQGSGATGTEAISEASTRLVEVHWIFGVMAVIMLPVAIFYHPPDETLSAAQKPAAD